MTKFRYGVKVDKQLVNDKTKLNLEGWPFMKKFDEVDFNVTSLNEVRIPPYYKIKTSAGPIHVALNLIPKNRLLNIIFPACDKGSRLDLSVLDMSQWAGVRSALETFLKPLLKSGLINMINNTATWRYYTLVGFSFKDVDGLMSYHKLVTIGPNQYAFLPSNYSFDKFSDDKKKLFYDKIKNFHNVNNDWKLITKWDPVAPRSHPLSLKDYLSYLVYEPSQSPSALDALKDLIIFKGKNGLYTIDDAQELMNLFQDNKELILRAPKNERQLVGKLLLYNYGFKFREHHPAEFEEIIQRLRNYIVNGC